MPTPVRAAAFPMIVLAALTACGGGGGGGGSTIREVPFTSFSAIAPNQTVVMPGLSLTGEGMNTGGTATSFLIGLPDESNSTARLTYNANLDLSGLNISTPTSSVAFGASEIVCNPDACGAANAALTALAVVIEPSFWGWNYQSFGVWLKDVTPTSFQGGAMSAGAVSPVSALPQSNATFTGHAGGWYFDIGGALHITDADMTAIANFGASTIAFSTSQTLMDGVLNTDLNLSGTLSYGTGNQFSGPVSTQGPTLQLNGTATGRFYGPNAEEIGGVYGLGSPGGERMLGGFGGRRP